MSASASASRKVNPRGTRQDLMTKVKGLRLAPAGDVLREAVVRLMGLKETLDLNDQGYLDLIDRVMVLTDGVLSRSVKGKAKSGDDDELASLGTLVEEISSWTENAQRAGAIRGAADHQKNSRQLARYNKLLDDIYSRVQLGVTLDIQKNLKDMLLSRDISSAIIVPSDLPLTEIPPLPAFMYGRDVQRKSACDALLNLAHIAVLGGGGMGKTAFAVTLLHDEVIAAKFGRRRIFVACDGVTTADGIITAMMNMLRVSAPQGMTPIQALVHYLKSLQPSVFVVLDNLESAWDTVQRDTVEAFLTEICNIPNLTLVVTMRGNRTPSGQRWFSFAPLEKLRLEDARNLFIDISGTFDDKLDELLVHLDGLPLAVTLMATLGQSTTGLTPAKLLQSYLSERTSMVETGTSTRLSSLDVSIMVSINCRTLQENPEAFELLRLLSLLPDGVNDEDLRSTFPEVQRCEAAARTLRAVALATYADNITRVLAPIRAFMQANYRPVGVHLAAMRDYYVRLASSGQNYWVIETPERHALLALLTKQMANLQSVLMDALGSLHHVALLDAIYGVSKFSNFTSVGDCTPLLREVISVYGIGSEDGGPERIARSQDEHSHSQDGLGNSMPGEDMDTAYIELRSRVADCKWLLGDTLRYHYQYDHAEALLNEAKTAYENVGKRNGLATCLWSLSEILRMKDDYAQATALVNQAKAEYADIGDKGGVATCLWSLGNILRSQGEYEQAARALHEAKESYSELEDRVHVANCLWSLGLVMQAQGDYDQAIHLLDDAKAAYTDLADRLHVATCLWSLGDVLREQHEYSRAAVLFKEAEAVYVEIGDRVGVADCLWSLGNILQLQGDYDQAATLLNEAREAYITFGPGGSIDLADCLQSLGKVLRMQGQLDEAVGLLNEAKAVYTDLGDRLGLAQCAESLGQVQQAEWKLAEAGLLFSEAQALYKALKQDEDAQRCQELLHGLSQLQAEQQQARHGEDLPVLVQSGRRLRVPKGKRFGMPKWLRIPGVRQSP